jgi:hypothetical protein
VRGNPKRALAVLDKLDRADNREFRPIDPTMRELLQELAFPG